MTFWELLVAICPKELQLTTRNSFFRPLRRPVLSPCSPSPAYMREPLRRRECDCSCALTALRAGKSLPARLGGGQQVGDNCSWLSVLCSRSMESSLVCMCCHQKLRPHRLIYFTRLAKRGLPSPLVSGLFALAAAPVASWLVKWKSGRCSTCR